MLIGPKAAPRRPAYARQHRRQALTVALAVVLGLTAAACSGATTSNDAASSTTVSGPEQQQVEAIARDAMTKYNLKSLIVRVTTDGQDTYTGALGESMTGVPATPDMQVRNGFVAYTYLTTMLLQFVDQKKISLDDRLSKYLPDLPQADAVTIEMLANSTSGYADYVYQPAVTDGTYLDPFRQWTTGELITIGTSAPPTFPPGTNWAYSHTNYAILGTVLAKVGGKPLSELMSEYIVGPMGLKHTHGSDTPQIPEPVLHTFSSERRETLGVPPDKPFYEESTFWNPSWTAPEGALQTTDVTDLTTSIQAVGEGTLLSPESHRAQVDPNLAGFGHPAQGCAACAQNTAEHSFGMAVLLQGPWIGGNKLYAGSGAIVGYLPPKKLAIAVVTSYQPAGFDDQGNVKDAGAAVLASLSKALAPDSPLPG
ncbi:beta-lactamase family protein [Rhodococcus spelaei]|uniref:Beta-lactamase family protein n=1 Tax=Rhodococcus spelaei TaxID=2546320 RepID=A0A541B9M9_9NOCA|nr:serine hydrolase domain-containing protein [Rhodococcus spelaei]TQF69014.1 beta-lactamase family protein [Rhodococcus spelaei]